MTEAPQSSPQSSTQLTSLPVIPDPAPAVRLPSAGTPPRLLIITGLSGAGRSTAAKCLEDLGWFVVDNLPPSLLAPMAELSRRAQGAADRVGAVVDVRSGAFFSDLRTALDDLARTGISAQVVFLEASDEALVRRFESVRRPHPLQHGDRLVDGIARERELLRDLRGEADLVLDTTTLNVHGLRAKIVTAFGTAESSALRATVVSFGYKYGLPVDADLVLDLRFLPNPHWVPELRAQTGLTGPVRDYVLRQPAAQEFLDRSTALLELLVSGYAREGKRWLTLAIGCTGGKHRSVTVAEELSGRLVTLGAEVQTVHRDLGRE